MLKRMYSGWASNRGHDGALPRTSANTYICSSCSVITVDETPDPIAGLKSTTFLVSGSFIYGQLLRESGVHRLVRFSPFNKNGSRHTSFASVQVSPCLAEGNTNNHGHNTSDIVLRSEDVEITTMKAQGAGGQHVNKTESAVRVVHRPTGLVVMVRRRTNLFTLPCLPLYSVSKSDRSTATRRLLFLY